MTTYSDTLETRFEAKIKDLARRLAAAEQQLASAAVGAVPVTSTTHPANPASGMQIFETDTGLWAQWNGTAWYYPPQQIQKIVLGTQTSVVPFPSIPQVFTNLRLSISAKSSGTGASGYDAAGLQFNNVSSASYNWSSYYVMQGGSAVSPFTASSTTNMQCAEIWNSFFNSNGRGIATIDIPNYSDVGNLKGFTGTSSASDGGTAGILQTYSGSLGGGYTIPITSLAIVMGIGNFLPDSTFTLFGF